MPLLARKLLNWYSRHARVLPWRGHPDSYAVWVSEIMLQQTRVEAVIPYFMRWMDRFPSIPELATAPEQEVLSLWEGLGYYSRARNLHKAAKMVVAEYGGQLPHDVDSLRKLPGIGRYTAAAITSMAFGQDVAALDGNIRRILSRVFDVETPADAPAGERILWLLAEENLPKRRAGDYNQALMDLGASICLPKNPRCLVCPLTELCKARIQGIQEQRPVLAPKKVVPHYTVTAAVIRRGKKVLLAQRPADGLLGGMWEFPGGKVEPGESLEDCLRRELREELDIEVGVGEPFGVYSHAFTHFRITLHAFLCELASGKPRPVQAAAVKWVLLTELSEYPMGKVDRQIARKLGIQ